MYAKPSARHLCGSCDAIFLLNVMQFIEAADKDVQTPQVCVDLRLLHFGCFLGAQHRLMRGWLIPRVLCLVFGA
jgi:hypothetical protein